MIFCLSLTQTLNTPTYAVKNVLIGVKIVFKKIVVSVFLIAFMFATFSVSASAAFSSVGENGIEQYDEDPIVIQSQTHWVSLTRDFTLTQNIPASITHTVHVGNRIFHGSLQRGVIANRFSNGVLIGYRVTYSGHLPFVGWNS